MSLSVRERAEGFLAVRNARRDIHAQITPGKI
jgi:hypothetical protein